MEIIIKKQIEILELENIIVEMKQSFNELIHRQSHVEKKNLENEHSSIQIIQTERHILKKECPQ